MSFLWTPVYGFLPFKVMTVAGAEMKLVRALIKVKGKMRRKEAKRGSS